MFAFSPVHMAEIMIRASQLAIESQMVIAMRVMGMAGAWPLRPDEMQRMVLEKGPAFWKAATKAQDAAFSGAPPQTIALAALKPLTRKARSNRRRLTRGR